MADVLRVLAVLGLIGANAFFVIAEYAVVTARRGRLTERAAGGSAGAAAALRLMDDPVRVISTVQVAITALGILTGAIGEPLVRDLLGDGLPTAVSFLIAFAIITYASVLLGELAPKALTLDRAEVLAAAVARPILAFAVLLRPAVFVLDRSAKLLLRPFGVRDIVVGDSITSPEELRALVDEAEQTGVIGRAQEELLHNVFRFADREAADIMRPAPDVVWLDASLTCAEALELALADTHQRYPVGRGSLDRLAGIVHLRDLIAGARDAPGKLVDTLARPVHVVPPTKDVGPLLRDLREQRQQLAVVADEYGGTVGIVAIEDILEELVGEIEDEFDPPDGRVEHVDERTVAVAGSMSVDDFNELAGAGLPEGRARTLAGLVFDALARRPEVGDTVRVARTDFVVEAVEASRITRLRARAAEEA